jgi:GNAT superfamily N-acetyltransferase
MSRDPDAQVRPVDPSEVGLLARLWYDGWQDAHAAIVPAELARRRTLPRFEERLRAALDNVRTVGPIGAPLGFALIKGDELYQLYVSAAARGTGVASTLIADAEARLRTQGVETAWLGCAIGNSRAARFYEKSDGTSPARSWSSSRPQGPFRSSSGATRSGCRLRPRPSRSNAVQRSRRVTRRRPSRVRWRPASGTPPPSGTPPSSGSGRGRPPAVRSRPGREGRAVPRIHPQPVDVGAEVQVRPRHLTRLSHQAEELAAFTPRPASPGTSTGGSRR